jgi:NTE family protein
MMPTKKKVATPSRPQTVLVLQGGGALGAYQVGVVEALHEAGIEPDWIIGTRCAGARRYRTCRSSLVR